jgi:restriction system protein
MFQGVTDGVPPGYVSVVFTDRRSALIETQISAMTRDVARRLALEPELLYRLHPRRFEEVIAEILRDMGFDIALTPETRDGGRDIFALYRMPFGSLLTIVECKRYSPHRPIGPDVVQRLLWVADNRDKASHAMVATTSSFTEGAKKLQRDFKWRLTLADLKQVTEWLGLYGKWQSNVHGGVWLPWEP